jgi:hypothetical protein
MMAFDDAANRLEIEHVSLIFGENYVISFQEHEGDVLTLCGSGSGTLRDESVH